MEDGEVPGVHRTTLQAAAGCGLKELRVTLRFQVPPWVDTLRAVQKGPKRALKPA